MRNIEQIMRLSPIQRKTEYSAVDIDKIEIDGNIFDNYSNYSFLWEKSYVTSPVRSASGAIDNLDSYATFITGHLRIDFSIMPIEYYRRLMQLIYSKNEFVVKCYDIVYNKTIKLKMYFATEEMPKLWTIAHKLQTSTQEAWEEWIELVGIQGYVIEMIGTNSSFDTVSVVYHTNPPIENNSPIDIDRTVGEDNIYKGEDIIIGSGAVVDDIKIQNTTYDGRYRFKHWVTADGTVYLDGYAYTINDSLVLYAVWEATTAQILHFNYGIAEPPLAEDKKHLVYSKEVVQNQPIGELKLPDPPSVDYDGKKKYPYYNPQWWKTPTKVKKVDASGNEVADSELIVTISTPYWTNKDSTIYLLYDVAEYSVYYRIDGQLAQVINGIPYDSTIPIPEFEKVGYTLDGWYTDNNYTNKVKGKMPPIATSLYARWVKK
jgi:uncharacterized repeat protein (TIGR02543 family)